MATYQYEVENDGTRYDFVSTLMADSDTGRRWIAEGAAEDFFDNHDGWESAWPIEFSIFGENRFLGCFSVDMEAVPSFSARKVQ